MQNTIDFINRCEAAYIREIDDAVEKIINDNVQLINIGGPSSSGKTITSMILTGKLEQMGKKAKTISIDDFFRNVKEYTQPDGSRNLDSIDAVDTGLLSQTLIKMLKGETVRLPRFDFVKGERSKELYEDYTKAGSDIIILEGLHALNPAISDMLPEDDYFDVYICVSRDAVMPDGSMISRKDVRFLRRLIRDYKYRGASPELTFYLWENVISSEDKYIIPFEGNADITIDSYMEYETCVIKHQAIKLLETIVSESKYFLKAAELLQKLKSQIDIDESLVPEESILREFLGGSSYYGR